MAVFSFENQPNCVGHRQGPLENVRGQPAAHLGLNPDLLTSHPTLVHFSQ